MESTRRSFLKTSLGAGLAAASASRLPGSESTKVEPGVLDRILTEPVLSGTVLPAPVRIQSLELLRHGEQFLVRARSTDGAESVTVPHSKRLLDVHPLLVNRILPAFIGKDARELEAILWDVYRQGSNYKLQGLLFWVCVATVEMALLDLLGQVSGKSIGELLGGVKRRDIGVYRASGQRGNTPEEEIEYLEQLVAETGARAIKFRLGGRMSNNADSRPGRTEALIPLVRAKFGDAMTLYADANSSYDVPHAVRIGRLLEEHRYALFEEPCPFDDLWSNQAVADALNIPVGLGEQEFSLHRLKWAIENRVMDVVQPDLHYFGGYLRCTQVARMAAAAGLPCTPHLSEAGLSYLNLLHFVSHIDDPGPFQEFKGEGEIPFTCDSSPLTCRNGLIRCPSGPGLGVRIDPEYVNRFKRVDSV